MSVFYRYTVIYASVSVKKTFYTVLLYKMAAAFVLLNASTPREKHYNEEYVNPFEYDDDRF